MLAKGIGCRQLATRIALYCAAKDAMSADEVPGIPLASDAPGAPAVEPPIADGQAGADGGVGVGVGVGATVTAAGVVVNVRPDTSALAEVAEIEDPCVEVVSVEVVVAGLAPVAAVEAEAGVTLPPRNWDKAAEELLGATVLKTMSALACDGATVSDGPAPWISITAATTAVARTTAFFNVCTPIQRLHCPPIETSAYRKT
jgi:hypothetical protein